MLTVGHRVEHLVLSISLADLLSSCRGYVGTAQKHDSIRKSREVRKWLLFLGEKYATIVHKTVAGRVVYTCRAPVEVSVRALTLQDIDLFRAGQVNTCLLSCNIRVSDRGALLEACISW